MISCIFDKIDQSDVNDEEIKFIKDLVKVNNDLVIYFELFFLI